MGFSAPAAENSPISGWLYEYQPVVPSVPAAPPPGAPVAPTPRARPGRVVCGSSPCLLLALPALRWRSVWQHRGQPVCPVSGLLLWILTCPALHAVGRVSPPWVRLDQTSAIDRS
jgi:hypothetical protein